MGLLRQLVITVLVIGVSSATTDQPPQTTASSTPVPVPSSTPLSSTSSSTTKAPAEPEETTEGFVVPSASIRQVETPAVIEEVSYDWSDSAEGGDAPIDTRDAENYEDDSGHADYPDDYYYGDDYAYADYKMHTTSDTDPPTQEDFEDNAPESLHDEKNIIINRDNLIPIMKTLILACTGKENPTYAELLKAGGITAFKTSLKHLGDKKLGVDLMALAKKLTTLLDSDEREANEEEDFLSEMAQDFLASHRFKLVLPESILLHETELKELLSKRVESEVEGRSASADESQLTIFMPRADPGVTTLLSFSPVPWIALFTGLLSLPYFLSDDSPLPVARADRPTRHPFRQLRPPGLPFIRQQQLRRDETDIPAQNQPLDQEFFEYKKKYAQWYHQWYLKHKEYYDKNYPFNSQGQLQVRPSPIPPGVRPPLRPGGAAGGPSIPRRKPKPPPQRRRKPAVQNAPPQPRVPSKRRRVRPGRLPSQRIPPAARPQGEGARNTGHSSVNAVSKPHPNTFGTFQNEGTRNHGDSHFRVFHGQELPSLTSVPRPSNIPSPQPVYIPTTNAPPTTETGFKPIIKPDAPVSDEAVGVRTQTVGESVLVPKQVKPIFRPPKQDDLSVKNKPPPVPKKKPGTNPTIQLASGGFKPISWPVVSPETTTRKVSGVTSSIFKTTLRTTPTKPTTPRPAVFVRTEKSVRVVTSSSVVTHPTHQLHQIQALGKQNRQHEPQSFPQSLQVAEESQPTAVVKAVPVEPQFLRSQHQAPAAAPGPSVLSRGTVRTNAPANIRVVDHRRPQGFGLGPKPYGVTDPSTTPTTTTTPTPSSTTTAATIPVFALDPFYGSRLSRIDVIFHQLKVEGEGCREQVVCNIYKNPEAFTPFSDFLSRQLTVTLDELRRPKVSDERILRFFRYLKAARDGQDGANCLARYSDCPQDTNALSHKPIVSTYQKVSRLMDASSS